MFYGKKQRQKKKKQVAWVDNDCLLFQSVHQTRSLSFQFWCTHESVAIDAENDFGLP